MEKYQFGAFAETRLKLPRRASPAATGDFAESIYLAVLFVE
jgi:hypothetical protein